MALKVVIAGDVSLDWYFWKRPSKKESEINYELYEGMDITSQYGGAILLSKMIKNSLGKSSISIIDQNCPERQQNQANLKLLSYEDSILYTSKKLDLFPQLEQPDSKEKVYRVSEFLGYTIPKSNPKPLSIKENSGDEDFVVIHDVGNGFRSEDTLWPNALTGSSKPIVIYQMYPPLFKGSLWDKVVENHKEKLVLILNAEDLREKLGANISRSLSWEKTALELLWEINNNPDLSPIKDLKNVIIRFKVEGAVHYTGMDKNINSRLYFDPSLVEGGFWDSSKFGFMRGVSLVFASSIASNLIKNSKTEEISAKSLKKGIEEGLKKSRIFMKKGYGSNIDVKNLFGYSGEELTLEEANETRIECTLLPQYDQRSKEPDPVFWSILKENTQFLKEKIQDEKKQFPKDKNHDKNGDLISVAMAIVTNGWSAIKGFPAGRFRNLTTVDRAEIESFGSLRSIMEGYVNAKMKHLNAEKNPKPLSISVFGSPGSGKSFGIIEVAKSIDPEKVLDISFNVSQFTSTRDLINAFHRIRDISITGKIPLVFFDEFDCTFESKPLGWLKYFLAPMQGGEFVDCGTVHPIGKSIFVFAGGVYKTFQEFCESTSSIHNNQEKPIEKCPDFISRLRGYVNILGPNRVCENMSGSDRQDDAYIIRRAVQLRSLIERNAPDIIDDTSGIAYIDLNLLKTLLIVPRYKHGVRSMEAIIDMSMLQGLKAWKKASLPPKDQLELHIDGKDFFTILENPDIYSFTAVSYALHPTVQEMCNYNGLR